MSFFPPCSFPSKLLHGMESHQRIWELGGVKFFKSSHDIRDLTILLASAGTAPGSIVKWLMAALGNSPWTTRAIPGQWIEAAPERQWALLSFFPSLVANEMSETAKERLVYMNPLWILLGAQWVLGWDCRYGASSVQGRAAGRGIDPCSCALIQSLWHVAPLHSENFSKITLNQRPNDLTNQCQLRVVLATYFPHQGFWIFSLSCGAFPLTCIYQCYWNNRGSLNSPKEEKPLSTAVSFEL